MNARDGLFKFKLGLVTFSLTLKWTFMNEDAHRGGASLGLGLKARARMLGMHRIK